MTRFRTTNHSALRRATTQTKHFSAMQRARMTATLRPRSRDSPIRQGFDVCTMQVLCVSKQYI